MKWVLSSKIHQATVTDADLAYVGSITIDAVLMEAAGFWPGEKVQVVSNTSGERLETYVISGERNSGMICMNGACAHKIKKGDEIIIMGYTLSPEPIDPRLILVDAKNQFVRYL